MPLSNPVLDAIRNRRHAGALMLEAPGPGPDAMEALLEAAAAAPDHGKIVPFRFVLVPDDKRAAFVEASLASLRAVMPNADEQLARKVRGKAELPPAIIALVARFQPEHPKIGMPDQWLTLGCALQNLWLAAESLGFACGVSSGRTVESDVMRAAFRLGAEERIVSIVAIGTPRERLAPRPKPALADVVGRFG